ncbi:MAG: ABC transporter substrate-binding protein [Methylococcales bacterium]|nr:ABC transporter substrate-binding protein [Methylococcales bacterium]
MRKMISPAALFLLSVICMLIGCGDNKQQDTIKVGLIVELTGDMPGVGASSKNAAQLAVNEQNSAGGISIGGKPYQIELVVEDNASKAEQSVAAVNKLITQDNVLAIVGPNASLGAIPAAEIAEYNKTLLITPWSTNPKTTLDTTTGKPKDYVFRACYTDPFEGRVLARFVLDKLKAKKVAVLYDVASEAPKSQADLFRLTFEELGGKTVAFETYTTGDRDFSAQLTKIKSANPDVIFLPAYYNDVGLIAQQAHRAGITQPLVGSDAWSSPELIKLSNGTVEGDYFANHYASDIATPTAKKFIDAYTKQYGNIPDDVAALSYDSMGLLFEAIKKSPSLDRKVVRDSLATLANYPGVTGNIQFTAGSGDPVKSAVIMQIKGDKFVWVMNAAP